MVSNFQDFRREADKKQKNYLRHLGYSDNVIAALFPIRDEAGIFLDNGSNLIEGFAVAISERKKKKV